MAESFRYPSPIEGCDCIICTRKGADDNYQEPQPLFQTYKLVRCDDSGLSEMSHHDFAEFEGKHTKHAEWLTVSQNPKNASWWKVCSKLLKNIVREKDSKPFKGPVDIVALNIPDYHTYVKHPMDLLTIEQRLNSDPCQYTNPHDFVSDVRMVFRNCFVYNQPNTYIWRIADTLSRKFEEQLISYGNIMQGF